MALIAREGAGITKDLKTLKGKRIAASFGTINHLYILALLEQAGLAPGDVTLGNTPPPDVTVALLSKGIDAFSCWDPWPIVAQKDVPGAVEIIRGGDVISYLGFNVGLRPWVEKNGDTVEKYLAALAEADQWMRKNPKQAAQVATRWIPGIKPDVAEAAMQFNIQQADRRLSANNYRALWAAQEKLLKGGFLKSTFDVNKHIEPKYIVKVMREQPQLFNDLPPSEVPPSTDALAPARALAVFSSAAAAGSAKAAAARLQSAIETSFCMYSSFPMVLERRNQRACKKEKATPTAGIAFAAYCRSV